MQLKEREIWTEGMSTLPDSLELVHDVFSVKILVGMVETL